MKIVFFFFLNQRAEKQWETLSVYKQRETRLNLSKSEGGTQIETSAETEGALESDGFTEGEKRRGNKQDEVFLKKKLCFVLHSS